MYVPEVEACALALNNVLAGIDNLDWINTPNGADELVNTLFSIQGETRTLINRLVHSQEPLTWKGDFKKLSIIEARA